MEKLSDLQGWSSDSFQFKSLILCLAYVSDHDPSYISFQAETQTAEEINSSPPVLRSIYLIHGEWKSATLWGERAVFLFSAPQINQQLLGMKFSLN